MPPDTDPAVDAPARHRADQRSRPTGLLIVNADDWGRTPETTDRIDECLRRGAVSSVSAMMFMEDSERAAAMALEHGTDAGLHVNFTTPFSSARCPESLRMHQQALSRWLRRGRFAQVMFHPGLVGPFAYVVAAQVDEFSRLYGGQPDRFDGHHHMHLCTNVLLQRLIPDGTIVRRSFSFQAGEKGWLNRLYRGVVDRALARRYRIVDRFFSLAPLEPGSRRQRIFSVARQLVVELETHPVEPPEYRFLMSGELTQRARGLTIIRPSAVPWSSRGRGKDR